MNELELALFIIDIGALLSDNTEDVYLDDDIITKTNEYIYITYYKNKEALKIICPYLPIIEECINKNDDLLTMDIAIHIIKKYCNSNYTDYLNLLEIVGYERVTQVNELALNAVNYYTESLSQKPIYNPYSKILQ